jgi:transcriptional regulator with XRE-family HTH domain
MDLREVFATNLRRLRHAKGLSQDDLAYEAEVSRSYLSQLEKGTFYASLKIIDRLAEALDVEPAALLKLPGERSSKLTAPSRPTGHSRLGAPYRARGCQTSSCMRRFRDAMHSTPSRSGGLGESALLENIHLCLQALAQAEITGADRKPAVGFLIEIQSSPDLDGPAVVDPNFAVMNLLVQLDVQ